MLIQRIRVTWKGGAGEVRIYFKLRGEVVLGPRGWAALPGTLAMDIPMDAWLSPGDLPVEADQIAMQTDPWLLADAGHKIMLIADGWGVEHTIGGATIGLPGYEPPPLPICPPGYEWDEQEGVCVETAPVPPIVIPEPVKGRGWLVPVGIGLGLVALAAGRRK